MTTGIKAKLKKIKKKRVLVISTSCGTQGNVQCLYLQISNTWELLSHVSIPYTQKINSLLEKIIGEPSEKLSLSDVAHLDYRVSLFCIESINTFISQLSTALKKPHYIIFNRLPLWRMNTGENFQQTHWDLSIGDPQLIASTIGIPVFTDFIRHNILAGGCGSLPLNPGNSTIVSGVQGKVALVNIGVLSRITIIDTASSLVLHDSDVGPGTFLLDKEVKQVNNTDSFDRDGSMAANGTVDSHCLFELASFPWFLITGPKQAFAEQFSELLDLPCVKKLSPQNRIATLTALTAKLIYDFYRREIITGEKIDVMYISGGAVHNLTLMEFLTTYFSPVPVKSIEELGVPADMRLPLALGLTVNAHINNIVIPWESGNCPKIESIGKWILP